MKNLNQIISEDIQKLANKFLQGPNFELLDSSDLILENVFTSETDANNVLEEYEVETATLLVTCFEKENFGDVLTNFDNVLDFASSLYFAVATDLIDNAMQTQLGKEFVESKEELQQVLASLGIDA